MSDVVRCKDLSGKVVALTQKRWNGVILPRRPEFADRIPWVELAMCSPEFITRDPDDEPWRYHYFKLNRGPRHELYVRVEIEFRRRGLLRSLTGVVMDVTLVPRGHHREKGETLAWSRAL